MANEEKTQAPQPQTQPQPQVEANKVNATAPTDNSDAPKKEASGKSGRVLEINEKLKGVLSVDERAALEAEKNQLDGSDAQGLTNKKNSDDANKDDDKENSFKEQDIIAYMYEQWLIKLFCKVGDKIEKYAEIGYLKMERRIIDRNIRAKAHKKKLLGSETYKTYEKVSELSKRQKEEVIKRDNERSSQVQNLAKIISEGKISDGNATDTLALVRYMGINAEDVQGNKEIMAIMEASAKYKKQKEDIDNSPDKKPTDKQQEALKKSKLELCVLGATFAQKEVRKIEFDSLTDQISINMAETKILDNIAHKGDTYSGKDIAEVFHKDRETAKESIVDATSREREKYIAGKNLKTATSLSNTAPVQYNDMGRILTYKRMAHAASCTSVNNISSFRFQENNTTPHENKSLKKLMSAIKSGRQVEFDEITRDKQIDNDYQQGIKLEKFFGSDNTPRNIGEEAVLQAKSEQLLQMQSSSVVERLNKNNNEWEKHLASPIASRIASLKRAKEARLIQEGANNKFKDWKIVRNQETAR